MQIYYFDCNFENCDEKNFGTDDEPDYEWVYHCNHPESLDGLCDLNNKYCEDKDDCKLLDKYNTTTG